MNLQNALALNSTPINRTVTVGRKSPHFQLVVKEDKTSITFSEEFMKLADIQNNKLNVYFEQGDNEVYFIFHQGDGEPGKSLAIDFFKGKRLPLMENDVIVLDRNNKKVMSEEIGKKNNLFLDAKTVSGFTIRELLSTQHPEVTALEKLSGTFIPYTEGESEFALQNITSIWTLILNESNQEVVIEESNIFNTNALVIPSPSNENTVYTIINSNTTIHLPEPVKEFVFDKLYPEANTTATAISNFENAGTVSASELFNSEELELENAENNSSYSA